MKVAIAGFRAEGKVSYEYWSRLGADITIVDENLEVEDLPAGSTALLGRDSFEELQDFDLVVRTASLNPNKITTNGKIWSATNEFFAECPAPIIGVTGTKGKGTTATLISKILSEAGYKTWLLGNIGEPALGVLDEIKEYYSVVSTEVEKSDQISRQARDDKKAIVVFELSSFQLWDLEKSPETAVVLMIEPDHMDVHADMAEYVEAKANITTHQSADDLLVYHPTNENAAKIASQSKAQKKKYMSDQGAHIVIPAEAGISKDPRVKPEDDNIDSDDGANIVISTEVEKSDQISRPARDDRQIMIEGRLICKTDEVGLLGEHNLENICAAITAAWKYTQDVAAIKKAVTSFKGLPHRLEFVRELNGVTYINDSFSTGPGSALAAIRACPEPLTVIIGGSDKGVDLSKLLDEIVAKKPRVILIGSSAEGLSSRLQARSYENFVNKGELKTMAEIVAYAQQTTSEGTILLSPAHASFDMFKNVYDRGDQFRFEVNKL